MSEAEQDAHDLFVGRMVRLNEQQDSGINEMRELVNSLHWYFDGLPIEYYWNPIWAKVQRLHSCLLKADGAMLQKRRYKSELEEAANAMEKSA